jgi:uncharacterized iron-regulated protein
LARNGALPARAGIHALLALLIAAAAGCADRPVVSPALEGRIWDVRGERFIGKDQLVRLLRSARHRLLGEAHDNPRHHELRAGLMADLAPGADVFFEQFDREHDGALAEAQRAGADADALAKAGRMDKGWKWPAYRPLVAAALASGARVRAANLSNADARRIAAAGALGPQDAALARAIGDADWPAWREAALRAEIHESHCRMLPEKVAPALALAQRARDAAIALAMSSAPGATLLIAGNGHVRRDLGVPLYLPPRAQALSVGFLETRAGETDPRDYARGAGGQASYDYIWFTPPQPRPDPCEALRNRPAGAAR